MDEVADADVVSEDVYMLMEDVDDVIEDVDEVPDACVAVKHDLGGVPLKRPSVRAPPTNARSFAADGMPVVLAQIRAGFAPTGIGEDV